MFKTDSEYTRDDIHRQLGGSKVSCLPMKDGMIVAACLLKSFSPAAPHVMLCGIGPRTTPVSDLLTRQREPLPVFVKRSANRWAYMGRFTVVESFSEGARFDQLIAGSGRKPASVSHAVVFEPVAGEG